MRLDNIKELNDLIREMEKRLEFFIGDNNLGRLLSFIDGFIYSKDINQIPLTEKEDLYCNYKKDLYHSTFYEWLKTYYEHPSDINVGRESIIMFHAGPSHSEATKKFFELYQKWHKEEFGEDAW